MLAAIVRFHRKSSPNNKHISLKGMRTKDTRVTIALAAILRLAAALNRTKSGDAAHPEIHDKKDKSLWLFDEQWFDEHDVCVWNGEQEKRPLVKLIGKPIQLSQKDN